MDIYRNANGIHEISETDVTINQTQYEAMLKLFEETKKCNGACMTCRWALYIPETGNKTCSALVLKKLATLVEHKNGIY